MAKKVKGFEDFNIEGEKEKLQKIKRSFKSNSDQQQFTTNTRNEFDEDTRKITAVTKDEVDDKLKSLEETNFGAMKESNGDFIPYRDSAADKEDMSLEEKMLKMNLNINQVNLTPLQMEVVIGAMKDLTTQRKNGNWTNKIR